MTKRNRSSAPRKTSPFSSDITPTASKWTARTSPPSNCSKSRPAGSNASKARFSPIAPATDSSASGPEPTSRCTDKGRMGMSNMWMWENDADPPVVPRSSVDASPRGKGVSLSATRPRRVVLGGRLRPASHQRPRTNPRLEPARFFQRLERHQEPRRLRQAR